MRRAVAAIAGLNSNGLIYVETTISRIGVAANDAEDLKLAAVSGQDFGNKLRSVEQQLRHLTGTRASHQPDWGKHNE